MRLIFLSDVTTRRHKSLYDWLCLIFIRSFYFLFLFVLYSTERFFVYVFTDISIMNVNSYCKYCECKSSASVVVVCLSVSQYIFSSLDSFLYIYDLLFFLDFVRTLCCLDHIIQIQSRSWFLYFLKDFLHVLLSLHDLFISYMFRYSQKENPSFFC